MNPQRALRELGAAARGLRVIAPLHASAIKHSYLVGRNKDRFVLRIDEPLAMRLGLDRCAEQQVLQVASRGRVGPEVVAMRYRAPAIMLLRYAPGRAWTRADLDDRRRIEQLAGLLRRVHALSVPGKPTDLAQVAARYARLAGEGAVLVAQVRRLLARAHDPAASPVLCHRDPNLANVVGFRRPMLIDWEYATLGDPLFDLAVLVEHHRLASRVGGCLLAAYFGSSAAVPSERFLAYRGVYRRIATLWRRALRCLDRGHAA